MSKTYVRSIKFSQSGETYWVKDADAQESIAALTIVYCKKEETLPSIKVGGFLFIALSWLYHHHLESIH